jgi:catalase
VLIENRVSRVQVLWLMGDRGLPKSYRHMNGYGSHTFSLINDKNERTWCKFHMKSEQGNESLTDEEGIALSGENPDLFNEDMFMVRSRNAGSILVQFPKSFRLAKRLEEVKVNRPSTRG